MKTSTKWAIGVVVVATFIIAVLSTIVLTRSLTLREVGIVSKNYFDIEPEPVKLENFENKYSSFLDDEKAEYICRVSRDFNVDSDLVVAILQRENPTLVVDATSAPNQNGSRDLGLFQLNDISLFSKGGFVELFWKEEFGEFNADNWKHNTYIAVRYIKDCQQAFGENNIYYIACAYNAGVPKAYKAWIDNDLSHIPYSTRTTYAPTVETNYKIWKQS